MPNERDAVDVQLPPKPTPLLPAALATVLAFAAAAPPRPAAAASLYGSRASMDRQNAAAREHDFTFLRDSAQVRQFVRQGWLVPLRGNGDFELAAVSYPYTRPEVVPFVAQLAAEYRAACGERLVITSLTRPKNRQPANASPRTVHPTGMALDLRRSWRPSCRAWLEDILLFLEDEGVLEATLERSPPHYHVALFPAPYARFAGSFDREESSPIQEARTYRVQRGDTLWRIARRHGTSVESLKRANSIRSTLLVPGQILQIPTAGR